jgi:hypothetical protein
MQFSLLENGIDSLKAAGDILLEYYKDYEFREYQIKDAIFHFMHGVEIITKYLLQEKDEKLLFQNLEEYNEAKRKMEEQKLNSIFDANPDIRTIDIMNALKRLNSQLNKKIDQDFINSIRELKSFRNQLMHYTVCLNDEEFIELVTLLRRTFERSLFLFKELIPFFEDKFNKVNREEPVTEYQQYMDELETAALMAYEDARLDAYAEMMEQLMENEIQNGK